MHALMDALAARRIFKRNGTTNPSPVDKTALLTGNRVVLTPGLRQGFQMLQSSDEPITGNRLSSGEQSSENSPGWPGVRRLECA